MTARATYIGPWRVDIEVRPGVAVPLARSVLARLMAAALDATSAMAPASIGLILSDDRELAALNAQHMGQAGPTDVLSFPLFPREVFQPTPARIGTSGAAPIFALPPGRRPHLGDIVVSVERAIQQAEAGRGGLTGDVQWSPSHELRLLVTHGVLHVCGWDHAEPEEEVAMRALERRLLNLGS